MLWQMSRRKSTWMNRNLVRMRIILRIRSLRNAQKNWGLLAVMTQDHWLSIVRRKFPHAYKECFVPSSNWCGISQSTPFGCPTFSLTHGLVSILTRCTFVFYDSIIRAQNLIVLSMKQLYIGWHPRNFSIGIIFTLRSNSK